MPSPAPDEMVMFRIALRPPGLPPSTPYSALSAVEVVLPTETLLLRELLMIASALLRERLGERLDFDPMTSLSLMGSVDFYQPEYDHAVGSRRIDTLAGVNRYGEIVLPFEGGFGRVVVGDLLRAADEGFLPPGDVRRPILTFDGWASRGGISSDWLEWATGTLFASQVMVKLVAAAKSGKDLFHVYDLLRARRSAQQWAVPPIDAPPRRLFQFLEQRELWSARQVSRLTGIDGADLAILMTIAGYDLDPRSGSWFRSERSWEIRRLIRDAGDAWNQLPNDDEGRERYVLRQAYYALIDNNPQAIDADALIRVLTQLVEQLGDEESGPVQE